VLYFLKQDSNWKE